MQTYQLPIPTHVSTTSSLILCISQISGEHLWEAGNVPVTAVPRAWCPDPSPWALPFDCHSTTYWTAPPSWPASPSTQQTQSELITFPLKLDSICAMAKTRNLGVLFDLTPLPFPAHSTNTTSCWLYFLKSLEFISVSNSLTCIISSISQTDPL